MNIKIEKDKLKRIFKLKNGKVVDNVDNNSKKRRKGAILFEEKNKKSNSKVKEFFKNLFLNKKNIKFSYYALLFAMIILCMGSFKFKNEAYNRLTDEDYITVSTFSKQDKKYDFINPIKEGKLQKIYSVDSVIYSKTLEMWKIHEGVDIKADLLTNVIASEDGKIEKIYEDSFFGNTIVIKHGEKYKTCYSNLTSEIKLKAGDEVKKGEIIGKVGMSSPGEIKDDSHLHFMMYENENLIDPSEFIKF